mmetsp:Transcript_49095/g.142267  ORF Transcript_49095/g.142267 Transcript_49095/m.142267 type:complete len:155 (-) Transcript_49095:115-579(-)
MHLSAMKSWCIVALLCCTVHGEQQTLKAEPLLNLQTDILTTKVSTAKVESKTPSKRPQRSSREMRERSMIDSLKHVGERGSEIMSCVSTCRSGPEKQSWKVCIERCLDNPLLRSMFLSMLPDDGPDTKSLQSGLGVNSAVRRKLLLSRARSSEL